LPAGSTHCTPPENSPELALATAFLLCVCVCVCVCERERECVLFVFCLSLCFIFILFAFFLVFGRYDATCKMHTAAPQRPQLTPATTFLWMSFFPMQLFLVGVLQVFCLCDTTQYAICIMQHIEALCVCCILRTYFFSVFQLLCTFHLYLCCCQKVSVSFLLPGSLAGKWNTLAEILGSLAKIWGSSTKISESFAKIQGNFMEMTPGGRLLDSCYL